MSDKKKKQTPSEYLREAADYMNELADWLEQFNTGDVQTDDDSSNPPGNPPPPPGPGHG